MCLTGYYVRLKMTLLESQAFASDWHWAENVDPKQIGGVNEYNLEIAQQRARAMIETAIDLCFNHLKTPKYPALSLS